MTLHLDSIPKESGVYLMKDATGSILYIGKAKNLRTRVKQYFAKSGDDREMIPFLIAQVERIDTIVTFTEKEALLLENTLIKKHKPKYNILLKDDKTFISIVINHKHKWPMVQIARFQGKPPKGMLCFGPFTNALAAKETLETLNAIFPLRECSDRELLSRKRPCLLHSIKRCMAPCVNKCSSSEYNEALEGAIAFLKGADKEILSQFKEKRDRASRNLEFEKAGALQRKIQQIEHVQQNTKALVHSGAKECDAFFLLRYASEVIIVQLLFRKGRLTGAESETFSHIASSDDDILRSFILQTYQRIGPPPKELLLQKELPDSDLIASLLRDEYKKRVALTVPQKGEKKHLVALAEKNAEALLSQHSPGQESREALLIELEESLGLSKCPLSIECFDTSHIAGSDLIAAKVSFVDGEKHTKGYRLFTIKGVSGPDDYGAMKEALTRSLLRSQKEDSLPDLLIVDGGKGHLNMAKEVLDTLNIASVDLIALTKENARHDKGLTHERVFTLEQKEAIDLPPTSQALHLLQRIRDEAHRFAITFHKKKRSKRAVTSALDSIPGIGPKKKKALLKHFGSVKRIKEASKEELKQVKELSSKDIDSISSEMPQT